MVVGSHNQIRLSSKSFGAPNLREDRLAFVSNSGLYILAPATALFAVLSIFNNSLLPLINDHPWIYLLTGSWTVFIALLLMHNCVKGYEGLAKRALIVCFILSTNIFTYVFPPLILFSFYFTILGFVGICVVYFATVGSPKPTDKAFMDIPYTFLGFLAGYLLLLCLFAFLFQSSATFLVPAFFAYVVDVVIGLFLFGILDGKNQCLSWSPLLNIF